MSVYFDGSLTAARQHGPPQLDYPFSVEGDQTTVMVVRTMQQLRSKYKPLPLNSRDKEYRDAVLVQERNFQEVGGGVLQWDRIFHSVPLPRRDQRAYVWTRPGFSGTGSNAEVSVTSVTAGKGWNSQRTLVTAAPHGYDPGDEGSLSLKTWAVGIGGGLSFTGNMAFTVMSTPDTTTMIVDFGTPFVPWIAGYSTATIISKISGSGTRIPKAVVVPATVMKDYWLPGITPGVATSMDIPLEQPFAALSADLSSDIDTLSDTTKPTLSEYQRWMKDRVLLLAEPPQVTRFMGNIFERERLYVPAV